MANGAERGDDEAAEELACLRADLQNNRDKVKRDHNYHLAALHFLQLCRDYEQGFVAEAGLPAPFRTLLRFAHEFIDACIQYREPAPHAMRLWSDIEAQTAIRRAIKQREHS